LDELIRKKMAANDIRILKHGLTVQRFRTEANVTVGMREGDAIKGAIGTGTNYVGVCLTGDPEQATDMFFGVSKNGGTETASADGVIDVELVAPGTVMECKATTVANVDTDAKILGIVLDHVAFDRSAATAAGVLTVDEDEGTDPDVHGLLILDIRVTDGMCFITPSNAWIGRGQV
jgi:hypothetical protein